MRLICPNCDAQYEIDDHAIPVEGRDVQCSNCGQTWFQLHPDAMTDDPDIVDAPSAAGGTPTGGEDATAGWAGHEEPRGEVEDEDDDGDEGVTAPDRQPVRQPEKQAAGATSDMPSDVPPVIGAMTGAVPRRKRLDEDVAAILREEADREARVRHAEGSALESQGDLGLDQTPRRDHAGQQSGRFADPFGADDAGGHAGKGRLVLPDIEQINTTLSPPENLDAEGDDRDETTGAEAEKRGFRRGFALTLVIGAILLAVYAFSPQIAQKVPALAQPLNSYASAVDAGRVWLDRTMTGLIARINASQ